jgi:hypothetical protein
MFKGKIFLKKVIPIVVVTWILSLITTLAIVHSGPFIPVGTNQIGDSAVTTGKIADGAIIGTKLADGSTTSAKILDGTIIAQDIADNSIITVKVADGIIATGKVEDNAITTAKIADSAIVTVKVGDNAITTSKLSDNAIITIKLADGAVTTAKILDGTITAEDFANNSVTSTKIADDAVTTTKIADYVTTNLKLAANAIPFNFTHAQSELHKTTPTWENITDMEVKITLQRNSSLLIMFSTEASISQPNQTVQWQAKVNSYYAEPGQVWLQPSTTGYPSSISYNFYRKGLTAGQYTIYMQWGLVTGGATVHVLFRTLTVIALPE